MTERLLVTEVLLSNLTGFQVIYYHFVHPLYYYHFREIEFFDSVIIVVVEPVTEK